MKFEYENHGLKVSYETPDNTVYSREVNVEVNGETRIDIIDDRQAAYIQSCLTDIYEKHGIELTTQEAGNKVCEIYWGIIL